MTGELKNYAQKGALDTSTDWKFQSRRDGDGFTYPFIYAYYAPFTSDPQSGGLLFTRDTEFGEKETPLIDRLSTIFGITATAMGRKKRARMSIKKRLWFFGTVASLALISLIPVPLTTLAPAEIVADTPI